MLESVEELNKDIGEEVRKFFPSNIRPKATIVAEPDAATTIIAARESSHGDYAINASIAQELKAVIRNAPGWEKLTPVQKESLDLDATKTARILAGDPDFKDHWDDKAGYAKLVSDRCSK
jgi:hypothetical protein